MERGILIHFGEIWLKGRNRGSFMGMLHRNIGAAISNERHGPLKRMRDRFFLELDDDSDEEAIVEKLSKVFGISRISPAVTCGNDLGSILKTANSLLGKGSTVRIIAHRSVKDLDFDSSQIVRHFIDNQKALKFGIDKLASDRLYINAARGMAYLYTKRVPGAGGLPVGSSGKAAILLSGGIDSPVASYYSMKRGLAPVYVHVHAFPSNDDAQLSKIRELMGALSCYSGKATAYIMPGHVFQSAALRVPKKYELVMFKLFLYRLAARIAKKEGADCLVGGESLGQVASQTISNIAASQQGVKLPILRPLIGMDKQEIIDAARRIGTYGISIERYRDVCSISARNPATRSPQDTVKRLWKSASMDAAVTATLRKSSVISA